MDLNKLKAYAKKVKQEAKGLDRTIIARTTGVSFEGRQELVARLKKSTPMKLERDRRNEYDFYAVKVLAYLDNEWQQVAFIPAKMSPLISRSLDNGTELDVEVHRITGGFTKEETGESAHYGLEVRITPKEY